jgi:hypothetical protein
MQCYSCFDDSNYQYHGINYNVKAEQEKYLETYKNLGKPVIECVTCGESKRYDEKEDGRWQEVFVSNIS